MAPPIRTVAGLVAAALALAACRGDGEVALPAPQEPTGQAVAHFCDMIVTDHPGPKGQIFLAGAPAPLWFPTVRDTIAYLMLPERDARVVAVYVNDMAVAGDWKAPHAGAWVQARDAWYVLDSAVSGGMGLPELVPFGTDIAAGTFAARHGGRIVRIDGVRPEDVFVTGADAS